MKNKHKRWYDSDPQLKMVLNFLEVAPDNIRSDVAMDIIQIILQEDFTSTDELINFSRNNYIGSSERWYDIDDLIHTAVEMIKLLNDDERTIVLSEAAQSIMYFTAHKKELYEQPVTGDRHLSDKSN